MKAGLSQDELAQFTRIYNVDVRELLFCCIYRSRRRAEINC